jgi:predicted small lipoprotein YifL
MKNTKTTIYSLCLFLFALGLNACGQKGPIEIERPQVIQEEELEETI